MKKTGLSPQIMLYPLQTKFKKAGCECSLKKDKRHTTLIIGYADNALLIQS